MDLRVCRQIRVFVSSTFQDMGAERTILVGKVFPMLAEYCRRYRMEFIGVDLRWGVSEEQSQRGETVSICMSEIEHCRPFFLGILGERYGWVPEGADRSVTEQEICLGALEAPPGTEAFFYLREPALTEDLCGPFVPDPRMDALKDRVRHSGFSVMDGYGNLDDFAHRIYEDMTMAIDRFVGDSAVPAPETEEAAEQLFAAEHYAANYVERPEYDQMLTESVRSGVLTLLTGEPGLGKTALVSRWVRDHSHDQECCVIPYFAGNAAQPGWEALCRYFLRELKRRLSLDYPLPEDREGLRRSMFILPRMAAKKSRVVLVIDEIEALFSQQIPELSWLPAELPEGVSIVVTAGAGQLVDLLRKRPHREISLKALTPEEIGHISQTYLAAHAKTLGSHHSEMVCTSPQAVNPLFLITLLSEIRHIGHHEHLTEQLEEYLACPDISALFEKVLCRFDREYLTGHPGLMGRIFALLEVSRQGLTEGELLTLTGQIPQAEFAPFYLALEPYTARNGGAIRIGISAMRDTVRWHYGLDEATLSRARQELIRLFTDSTMVSRRAFLLPWLLNQAGEWSALSSVLAQPEIFREVWEKRRSELKEYRVNTGISAAETYEDVLHRAADYDPVFRAELAEYLLDAGSRDEAETLLLGLTEEDTPEDVLQDVYGTLGKLCQRMARFREAEGWYKKKYVLSRKLKDRYEQQRAMGNIGTLSLLAGDTRAALEAFEGALALAQALNQRDGQQIAWGNLGNVWFARGEMDKAKECYTQQKAVSLDSGNTAGWINACGALGILYSRTGDLAAAEKEFLTQQEESRRAGSADGIANSLGNLASVAHRRGQSEKAEKLLREKLTLCREAGLFAGEQNALGNLSSLAAEKKQLEEALALAAQRTALTRQHRAFQQYADALHRQALLEQRIGRHQEAYRHEGEAVSIARQHGYTALLREAESAGIWESGGENHEFFV